MPQSAERERLVAQIARLMPAAVDALTQLVGGETASDQELLQIVYAAGRRGMTQVQLCEALALSPPTVSRMIDQAERRGTVVRMSHPFDRRSKVVQLTPAGLDAANEARHRQAAAAMKLCARLSQGELSEFDSLLTKLTRPGFGMSC